MSVGGSSGRSSAVMATRQSAPTSLDFFPTPPWATRALVNDILLPDGLAAPAMTCWEPCCGAGHMAIPLAETFQVFASDVHDWGHGDRRDLDFTFAQADDAPWPVDWVIMNPPFLIAERMLDRALSIARRGVAMFVRLQWLEGGERYRLIFAGPRRPRLLCPFAERVAIIEHAWDPEASSATAYAWFVWTAGFNGETTVRHIGPGAAGRYTRLPDMALASPGEAARRKAAKKKAAEGKAA